MRLFNLSIFLILTSFFSCTESNNEASDATASPYGNTLFTLMDAAATGLAFNNQLQEGINTNILMYEYFYNGGGVAAADFNGDGLIDVYLTSNMLQNKLFLNMGDLKFEDVTAAAGVAGRNGPWKTGVSVADVNGDARPDIFVCYSGMVREENRINQLFINQGIDANGIPTFIESAGSFGLAKPAFTNQAYFFDHDRDGDLDLLLLNHNPVSLPILNENSTATLLQKDDPQRGIRLLRQTKGKFEDITVRSGINGSALSYGLGAGIADLNSDQWPDIYVSNDYSVPDYLYINNRNGTYTNKLHQSLGHTSQFSMGNDVADINNDGHPEIFTLDMLPEGNERQKLLMSPDNYAKFDLNVRSGFYYQYMRNMLHLNNGNGTFSEIGQLAGVSNTDWSWAALLADLDNDGFKDLLVTNGYVRDYTNLDFIKYMDDYVKRKGRLIREEVQGIIEHMPSSNVVNYVFANVDGHNFVKKTKEWGMDFPSNSNGAAYADLDNDGDLDIIVNNINQNAFLYRNNSEKSFSHYLSVKLNGDGMNTSGIGAKITIWKKGQAQTLEQMPARGYLSTVSPVLHFGLGESELVDSLHIRWPGGRVHALKNIAPDQQLVLHESEASNLSSVVSRPETIFTNATTPLHAEVSKTSINDFKRQPLLISQLSFSGPRLVKGDVNNDGLEDVYLTGEKGVEGKLFIQNSNGTFREIQVRDFENDKDYHDADAVFADVDSDGFKDLYVASGGYHDLQPGDELLQDRLYLNDKKGSFTRGKNWLPSMKGAKSSVATGDFNNDGRIDIFVGGRSVPGRYPEPPDSYLLINESYRFIDQTDRIAPSLRKAGMVTDAVSMDVNDDGKDDLIIAGEWMPISVFTSDGKTLSENTSSFFDKEYSGWWNSVDTADFNNDGRTDLIAGNLGLNSQCKASDDQPAEMFYSDFDRNGSVDPLFCFYIQGVRYPYITRDELLEQIGGLRARFTDYKSYANALITDIVSEEQLKKAGYLKANHFQTTVFLGDGSGTFRQASLPQEAQYSPVYTATILDYNKDGNQDLLLCGNNSKLKLKMGKSDANYGMLLKGDGQGGFQYIDQQTSGLAVKGDVRSVIVLNDDLFFGINEKPVMRYRLINPLSPARPLTLANQ